MASLPDGEAAPRLGMLGEELPIIEEEDGDGTNKVVIGLDSDNEDGTKFDKDLKKKKKGCVIF